MNRKTGAIILLLILSAVILSGCVGQKQAKLTATPTPPVTATPAVPTVAGGNETFSYIDVHAHLHGKIGVAENDFEGAAGIAVDAMEKWNIQKMLVMPPPFTNQQSQDKAKYEIDEMAGVLKKYPGRFAFLGGGEELNVMIQKAVTKKENISIEQFKTQARQVAGMDGFAGFGEMATLHFCMGAGHVYESADPDHELFKALVDVAAEKNVPIDIHQEAVLADMPFPTPVTGGCSANPDTLRANIDKFKNLLAYAGGKNVTIIWDHVGWDNTGKRTASLCDELLGQYDNLYMSIKISPNDAPLDNSVVDANGNIKQEWLSLFQKYPDRFMIGSDQFFMSPESSARFPPSMDQTWSIIDKLPYDLKKKIGYENARNIFNLG
jgi:hypothetical protein